MTLLRVYASPLLLLLATPFYAIAEQGEGLVQPDFTAAFLQAFGEPNGPAQLSGLPVLSPVRGNAEVWEVPCGSWRRAGSYEDPEGLTVSVAVLASDLECEATASADGLWALTVPRVTAGWHFARVRATDTPPEGAAAATRDVEIWFRGMPAANLPPRLL